MKILTVHKHFLLDYPEHGISEDRIKHRGSARDLIVTDEDLQRLMPMIVEREERKGSRV